MQVGWQSYLFIQRGRIAETLPEKVSNSVPLALVATSAWVPNPQTDTVCQTQAAPEQRGRTGAEILGF